MQTHPANWASLLSGPHITQYKYTINGVVCSNGNIQGTPTIEKPMMLEPVMGRCCTGTLTITIRQNENVVIPKAAPISVDCRLASSDGATVTNWIPQGRFWITKRSGFGSLVTLTARDAMIFAGRTYADRTAITTWPAPMSSVLNEIASLMNVQVDARTQINTGASYVVNKPEEDILMSEILGTIAAAHGGNFIVTESGKLRLVPFPATGNPAFTLNQAYHDYTSYSVGNNSVSRVTLTDSAGKKWTSESGSTRMNRATRSDSAGIELSGSCEMATQEMVNAIASSLIGHTFTPYQIKTAYLDPCIELGDTISAVHNGSTLNLIANTIRIDCTTGYTCEIENGIMQDDEEEIKYSTPGEVERLRGIRTTDAIKQSINSVRCELYEAESGIFSEITQTATEIRAEIGNAESGLYSVISATAESVRSELYAADSRLFSKITQTATEIRAEVTSATSNLQAQITVNGEAITSKVSAGDIASTINQTAQSVLISASKINLTGYVTATEFNAEKARFDNLTSGLTTASSLSAMNMSTSSLSASRATIRDSLTFTGTTYSSYTIRLPNVASSAFIGTANVDLSHSHVITMSETGGVVTVTIGAAQASEGSANFSIAATQTYINGVAAARSAGVASVTISNSDIVRDGEDYYNTSTHNTTIYIEATASNGAQGTQSFVVSGASAYAAGQASVSQRTAIHVSPRDLTLDSTGKLLSGTCSVFYDDDTFTPGVTLEVNATAAYNAGYAAGQGSVTQRSVSGLEKIVLTSSDTGTDVSKTIDVFYDNDDEGSVTAKIDASAVYSAGWGAAQSKVGDSGSSNNSSFSVYVPSTTVGNTASRTYSMSWLGSWRGAEGAKYTYVYVKRGSTTVARFEVNYP